MQGQVEPAVASSAFSTCRAEFVKLPRASLACFGCSSHLMIDKTRLHRIRAVLFLPEMTSSWTASTCEYGIECRQIAISSHDWLPWRQHAPGLGFQCCVLPCAPAPSR